MRHGVDGRKFGRNTPHRVAMFRSLGNALLKEEQIVTTIEKAKETRRVAERLITLAKRGGLNARRIAFDRTRDALIVGKLFDELAKRYAKRDGGYSRIVKVSETRWGDGAKMAMIELVDHPPITRKKQKKETTETTKDAAAPATASDPFSKMRKVFGKKNPSETKTKAPKAPKAAPVRKTAATKKSDG